MAGKKLDFEQSMARLEEIVGLLERGDAPLDEAMALFEEGAKLMRECTKRLDQAAEGDPAHRRGGRTAPGGALWRRTVI